MRIPNDFARRMSIKVSEGEDSNYFKLDNVSPEGAAMTLSVEKRKNFRAQTKLKGLVVELNDHIFKVGLAVIQHTTPLEGSSEFIKVGMRFKEVDQREKGDLAGKFKIVSTELLKKMIKKLKEMLKEVMRLLCIQEYSQ